MILSFVRYRIATNQINLKEGEKMKTTLRDPDISEMIKLSFDLVNVTSSEKQVKTHELEKDYPPWDSWFYAPVNIGNIRFFECWHKSN